MFRYSFPLAAVCDRHHGRVCMLVQVTVQGNNLYLWNFMRIATGREE